MVEIGFLQKEPARGGAGERISFQMNPSEFKTESGVDWSETISPGSPNPFFQFVTGKQKTLTVSIFLDGMEPGRYRTDIRSWVKFLESLPQSNARFNRPDSVTFAYGSFVALCDVVNVSVDYTMFSKELEPIRADATIELRIVPISPHWSIDLYRG